MIEYEGVTFAFVVLGWFGFVCALRVNSTLQVAVIYTGINAAWVMTHPLSANPGHRVFGELLSLQAFLAMAMGCLFVGWTREAARAFGRLLWFATALSILASWVFESDIPANWWTAGLITNPSMNAAMMVVTLPFAVWGQGARVQTLSVAVTIAVAVMSQSMTPVLAMLVLVVAYVWTLREQEKDFITIAGCIALFVTFVLAVAFDAPGDNQRLRWWWFYAKEWKDTFSWWWGSGANQFMLVGPLLGLGHETTERWAHLHSDILQVVFELGLLGGLLWALVLRKAILLAKYRFPEFYTAQLTFLVPLAIYFPLHTSLGATVAALLLWPLLGDPGQEQFQGRLQGLPRV